MPREGWGCAHGAAKRRPHSGAPGDKWQFSINWRALYMLKGCTICYFWGKVNFEHSGRQPRSISTAAEDGVQEKRPQVLLPEAVAGLGQSAHGLWLVARLGSAHCSAASLRHGPPGATHTGG